MDIQEQNLAALEALEMRSFRVLVVCMTLIAFQVILGDYRNAGEFVKVLLL